MPTEAENINYLYLVLTYDGTPTVSTRLVSHPLSHLQDLHRSSR
jgi:hypothetical protein